jgi:ABC-2 type transport system permease protein
MYKVAALIRAGWLAATSYRLGVIMSFGALILGVVPVFFVTRALQPAMAGVIAGEGDQFFAFIIIGMTVLTVVSAALYALPNALQTGATTGTIEALLATPTPVPTLLAGLAGYEVLYAMLRDGVVLLAAIVMGAHVTWDRFGAVAPILLLVVLAHIPIGIIAAAMVLAFRTQGPLPQLVFMLSTFLGGVYYPTHVIPGAIQVVSARDPRGAAGGQTADRRLGRSPRAPRFRRRPVRRERDRFPGRSSVRPPGRHARAVLAPASFRAQPALVIPSGAP